MNREMMFDAITDIREDLIVEAETHVFQRAGAKIHWQQWAAMAAGLALVLGLGAYGLSQLRMGSTGSGGSNGSPAAGIGGFGDGGASSGTDSESYDGYTSYAGPVLPLTALVDENTKGITAERYVDYDFSSYAPDRERWPAAAEVTDGYTLTNGTDADKTLTLLYPVALSFSDDADRLPSITVNGAAVSPTVCAGPYAGGFQGAGEGTEELRLNLTGINTWEDWQTLLSDGRYQAAALAGAPELTQPVTVYQVYDYVVAPTDAVNPTLQMSFDLDYDKTAVLVWGSNGGTDDDENGWCSRIVMGLGSRGNTDPMYVILLGEDIDGYTLQGYRNGACEPGEEIEISAAVERSETTLGAFLRRVIDENWGRGNFGHHPLDTPTVGSSVPRDLLYGAVAEMLRSYGAVSEDPAERYEFGMLEELMGDSYGAKRVLYLAFDVTVPAGGSIEVSADMMKTASYNFPGAGADTSLHGYSLAVSLGSALDFTMQSASISGMEYIELPDDNFDFDPTGGVTEAQLDLSEGYHWMQVHEK